MAILREADFDKLAARVVDQFLSGHAKLADAAAEQAASSGLNPDQIQRLVEASNTLTFLRLMDQRKAEGAGDLLHEFDPVDSRHVIRIVIDNAGVHVDPPDGGEPEPALGDNELPDEMSPVRLNPAEGEPGHEDSPDVETCEEDCHDELDPPGVKTKKKSPPTQSAGDERGRPEPSPKKTATYLMRMRKLASVLEDQQRQAAWAFEDTFRALSDRFRRAYSPSYAAFEKDAMAERGDDGAGVAVLNLLRSERRLPPIEESAREKLAALADHHVSDETPELGLFESLVKIARESAKLERCITWVKNRCTA